MLLYNPVGLFSLEFETVTSIYTFVLVCVTGVLYMMVSIWSLKQSDVHVCMYFIIMKVLLFAGFIFCTHEIWAAIGDRALLQQ